MLFGRQTNSHTFSVDNLQPSPDTSLKMNEATEQIRREVTKLELQASVRLGRSFQSKVWET